MRLSDWARRLADFEPAHQLFNSLDSSSEWHSIAPEARPVLLAASYLKHPRKVMVLAATYDRCLAWQAKLTLCGVPEYAIHQLASGTSALFEDAAPHAQVGAVQINVLPSGKFRVESRPYFEQRAHPAVDSDAPLGRPGNS